MGRTTVRFADGRISIQIADADQTGEYTCLNGNVVANLGAQELQGKYDPVKRVLVLNGIAFEQVSGQ
jgi:glutamine cyclotransferase